MNNDIKIDNIYGSFKNRVNGILIHDNKLLLVKIHSNSFYCLPGGHVKVGESSEDAVIREMKEETNFDVNVDKLIAITENFFTRKDGKKIHELGFYYLLDIDNQKIEEVKSKMEDDNITLDFKWVDINNLDDIEFKPIEIKEKIINNDTSFNHIIIK